MRKIAFFLAAAGCLTLTNAADAAPSARATQQLAGKAQQPAILPDNDALTLRYTIDYAVGCSGSSTGETVVSILNRSVYPNNVHIKFFDITGELVGETSTITIASNESWVFATSDTLSSPSFPYIDLTPGYFTDPCTSFVGYAQIHTQRMPIQAAAWTVADGQATGIPLQRAKYATGNN